MRLGASVEGMPLEKSKGRRKREFVEAPPETEPPPKNQRVLELKAVCCDDLVLVHIC